MRVGVIVRFPPDEKAAIQRAAKLRGQSMSNFLRLAGLSEARRKSVLVDLPQEGLDAISAIEGLGLTPTEAKNLVVGYLADNGDATADEIVHAVMKARGQ